MDARDALEIAMWAISSRLRCEAPAIPDDAKLRAQLEAALATLRHMRDLVGELRHD